MKKDLEYANRRDVSGFFFGLFFFLAFRISSWICSIPMWLTLILHFVIGLNIGWFWATLAAWLLVGIIHYSLILFARWGGNTSTPNKENKNPYSNGKSNSTDLQKPVDITFKTNSGVFNYRVCAVMKHDGKLLAMKNYSSPYYYLPGGRVNMNETAEGAIIRELKEELGIEANVIRPLWLNQGFFIEDTTGEKFHELCVYYLVDVSGTDLVNQPRFAGLNTKNKEIFEWLDTDTLNEQYLYPLFIKKRINELPEHFEVLTEREY